MTGVFLLLSQLALELLLQMVIVLRILLLHQRDLSVLQLVSLELGFALLWRQLWAERSLVTKLGAVVAHGRSLRHLFTEISRSRKLEAWMHVFARFAFGTESGEIILAQNASNMPMPTAGAMPAKTSIVPRAILDFALGVDVEESALFLVACVESRVEVAFGHLGHVILVQELAAVAFLAQRSQPMLADDRLLFGFDVAKRAEFLIASS